MYNVGIYKISFVRIFLSSVSVCANAFLYIPTMYLYCIYPAISKHTKTCQTLRKKTRYKVVLIVFNGQYVFDIIFCLLLNMTNAFSEDSYLTKNGVGVILSV